jgi:cell wall-associated NlpC family hydrolase
MVLNDDQKAKIRAAAITSYQQRIEACGLIVDGQIVVCKNKATEEGENPADTFVIGAEEFARRNIQAVWHSHNNGRNQFSPADVRACRKIQVPFVLHDTQNDRWRIADPSYEVQPLQRDFTFGVEDCYMLVCRYYWQRFKIRLEDYDRAELYDQDGNYIFNSPDWNQFRERFDLLGFEELSLRSFLKPGDVLLMQVNGAANPNHLGVITGRKITDG